MKLKIKPILSPRPWGFEILFAHTEKYVGKILHINAGHLLSLQFHKIKDETIYLQSGKMSFEYYLDGQEPIIITMLPGDAFHIPAGLRHRMTALEDTDILEASTPELDDIVRLKDVYGRV